MEKRYQVFVSSTYADLQDERHEIIQALLELDCIPAGMELFPAANDDQWTLIKRIIDSCDYYIVIIAGRYGSVGTEGLSYTEMEYRYALAHGKPIIAFIHKNPESLPANRTEQCASAKKKLVAFRNLAKKKACRFWNSPMDLGGQVSRSLIQLIKCNPAVGWVRGNQVMQSAVTEPPETVFARSLIEFTRSLARQHRDQTLLDIRSWANRILHLIGAISERKELGQLALEAAAAAKDRLTQASILIDDLGWSVHESGDSISAQNNIEEALALIEQEIIIASDADRALLIALKLKALRHLANIRSIVEDDLAVARSAFVEPRFLASQLDLDSRDLNIAQLDHSEALVILRWIEKRAASNSSPVVTESSKMLLAEATSLVENAEQIFHSLGDTEREVKALKLRVDILAYDTRKQLHREAEAKLERMEVQAARRFR